MCVFWDCVVRLWVWLLFMFGFLGNENLSAFLDSGLEVEACKMSEN